MTPARKHKDATLTGELIDENEDATDDEQADDGEDEDEDPNDLEQREQIAKHNSYHDKLGRFTTAEGAVCRHFHEMSDPQRANVPGDDLLRPSRMSDRLLLHRLPFNVGDLTYKTR